MKIKIRIGKPAALSAIEAFEKKHDLILPDDYRSFLGSLNGGRPEMDCRRFTIQIKDDSSFDSLVDWFNGLFDGEDYSLEQDLDIYGDRIPKGTLPIACDPFGNLILLGVKDSSISGVWFWDHEIEPSTIHEKGIYKIAENFDQFIKGLCSITS